MHEVRFHVRFFSSDPYDWSGTVVKKITRKSWRVSGGYINKDIHVVVTERVREAVAAHFNCNLLEGAELEDQGIEGTALAHWEKRVFEVSCTGASYQGEVGISKCTPHNFVTGYS